MEGTDIVLLPRSLESDMCQSPDWGNMIEVVLRGSEWVELEASAVEVDHGFVAFYFCEPR